MEVLTAENVDSEVQEAAAEMLDQMAGGSGSPVEVLKMDHIERLVAALRTIRNTKAQVFLLRVIRTQVRPSAQDEKGPS